MTITYLFPKVAYDRCEQLTFLALAQILSDKGQTLQTSALKSQIMVAKLP